MTEKTAEWFLTQGALGVLALLCLAALVWIALRRENDRKEHREELGKLHEAHKAEMRENGKALLTLAEKVHLAVDRLSDLEEARSRRS